MDYAQLIKDYGVEKLRDDTHLIVARVAKAAGL